jgi:hypothetical protein
LGSNCPPRDGHPGAIAEKHYIVEDDDHLVMAITSAKAVFRHVAPHQNG